MEMEIDKKGALHSNLAHNIEPETVSGAELLHMPEEEYRKSHGVNWSALKSMTISPAQYKWEMDHPRDAATKEMALGTIIHMALMTPEAYFEKKHVATSGANRGTKGFQKEEKAYSESILVTPEEHEMILMHIDAFQANDMHGLITKDAVIEQSIRWTDLDTGIVCKGRPDMYNNNVLVDIKTSRHIEDKKWWWDFVSMKYHCQFAYYHDALYQLDGLERKCICVKVETTPCFDVVYYPLPYEAIAEGRYHYKELLQELKDCSDANLWPGKGNNELAEVNFSRWQIRERFRVNENGIYQR